MRIPAFPKRNQIIDLVVLNHAPFWYHGLITRIHKTNKDLGTLCRCTEKQR